MFIQVIFLFLLNFIVLFFFGKYLGASGSIVYLGVNFLIIIVQLISIGIYLLKNVGIYVFNPGFYFSDFIYSFNEWMFSIDTITLAMLIVVCTISILVHCYSISYMQYDPHFVRFLSLLSLFTFCMLILVTSTNFIQLFFGWEGVGICSYLLVNFWFTRIQANKSALKAMLMNRFGDVSLLVAISIYYYYFRTFDFSIGFLLAESYKFSYVYFIFGKFHFISLFTFFLLIAAVGKSAQLGLHTWLPDAMEGPTPVSALIHAATMVTAGIFLIIRMAVFFEYSFINTYVLLVGGVTALFGSLVAVLQNDIKRVIAYSTCSQLGYMMVACGLFRYDLALFHLFNHAFFKALLFLSSGVVLHALANEQDMRKMGGLVNHLPFTYVCILLGSYALMGLPFLSGFYSKDVILELSFFYYNTYAFVTFWLILFAAFFTAVYSFRLIYMVFFGKPKGFFVSYRGVEEGDLLTLGVLVILSFLSLFVGYYFKEMFIGVGSYFINIPVKPLEYNIFFDSECLDYRHKLLPLFFSLFGLYMGYYYLTKPTQDETYYMYSDLYRFIAGRWLFDFIYNYYFVYFIQYFGYNVTYKVLDKNLFELFGARGMFSLSMTLSQMYSFFYNSSYIYMSIFLLILSLLFVLFAFLFTGFTKTLIYMYLIYMYIFFFLKK